MKFKMHHKAVQRFLTVLMSFALIVSSTAGYTAKAATGTIDDKQLLNSEVIKDAALLAQLKALTKEAMGGTVDDNEITVKNLIQKVTGDIVVNGDVKDISGIGYVRNASSIDLSQCEVSQINDNEFEDCNMTKIILPTTVTRIGKEAFKNCSQLASISLKDADSKGLSYITYIGDNAFSNCSKLNDDTVNSMKDTVEYLGANAFSSCTSITSAKVPVITGEEGKQMVPANLFSGCTSLAKVKLCEDRACR